MNTIDIYIFKTALLYFISFLTIHVVIFRLVKTRSEIKLLTLSFFLTIIILNLYKLPSLILSPDSIISLLISLSIYTLLVLVYIIGFFGIMVASVRVRLLELVARAKDKGISQAEILKIYNRDKIIKKRLVRMVANGDLVLTGSHYRIGNRLSVFLLHGVIFRLLKKLYL